MGCREDDGSFNCRNSGLATDPTAGSPSVRRRGISTGCTLRKKRAFAVLTGHLHASLSNQVQSQIKDPGRTGQARPQKPQDREGGRRAGGEQTGRKTSRKEQQNNRINRVANILSGPGKSGTQKKWFLIHSMCVFLI